MSRKYQPSNGTEGMIFCENFCNQCIHGKYEHTADLNDKPCDILTATYFMDIDDKEYPKEWIYDENNKPSCTAFVKFDWEKGDDGDFINPPINPDDGIGDNQLMLFSITDDILQTENQNNLLI
jgi:hypothetical protein